MRDLPDQVGKFARDRIRIGRGLRGRGSALSVQAVWRCTSASSAPLCSRVAAARRDRPPAAFVEKASELALDRVLVDDGSALALLRKVGVQYRALAAAAGSPARNCTARRDPVPTRRPRCRGRIGPTWRRVAPWLEAAGIRSLPPRAQDLRRVGTKATARHVGHLWFAFRSCRALILRDLRHHRSLLRQSISVGYGRIGYALPLCRDLVLRDRGQRRLRLGRRRLLISISKCGLRRHSPAGW